MPRTPFASAIRESQTNLCVKHPTDDRSTQTKTTGTPHCQTVSAPRYLRSNSGFTSSLSEYCLFQNSSIDRFAANLIYPLSRWLAYRTPPIASLVVDDLTLWEKYLAHRSRNDRRMTFSVTFKAAVIPPQDYLVNAITGFYKLLQSEHQAWHHQPLNVMISDEPRSRILDPRRFNLREFRIGIVDANRSMRVLTLDITRSEDSAEHIDCYVARQIEHAAPSSDPISVVFDEQPKRFDDISGSYAEYPGAWLRMAPDRATGGLLSSADHIVIDGSLHQLLLLRTAAASAVSRPAGRTIDRALSLGQEHVISFELSQIESVSELILQIGDSLEEQGIHLRKGHETSLLTTIPQAGPEYVSDIPRNRSRIQPVLLQMRKTNTPKEVREHIRHLNLQGWLNPLAFAIDRIYCGNTCPAMIRYFERFSMWVPFQRAARFLVGSALISFVPALESLDLTTDSGDVLEIDHLAATTLRSLHGMPAILIQQLPGNANSPLRMFVSISGSRNWDSPKRLLALANSLRHRLGLSILS